MGVKVGVAHCIFFISIGVASSSSAGIPRSLRQKWTNEYVLSCAQRLTSYLTSIEDLLPFITSHCFTLLFLKGYNGLKFSISPNVVFSSKCGL